jgi:hypothetical protein
VLEKRRRGWDRLVHVQTMLCYTNSLRSKLSYRKEKERNERVLGRHKTKERGEIHAYETEYRILSTNLM